LWGNNSNVCSGNGYCTGTDVCTCFPNWVSPNCSLPVCNGHNASDVNVCNGHGVCISNNTCLCEVGNWTQRQNETDRCDFAICDHIVGYNTSVCNSRGTCVSPNSCACNEPEKYTGNLCQFPICNLTSSNESSVCSGHGSCVSPETCICSEGYSGTYCNIIECYQRFSNQSQVCEGRGTCVKPDTCVCHEHYHGNKCQLAECFGFIANESSVCSFGNGSCIDYNECVCSSGYIGENCQIPICHSLPANESTVCSGHGSCVAHEQCNCHTGLYDGNNCQYPICYGNSSSAKVCSGHGDCVSPDHCICNDYETNFGEKCQFFFCNSIPSNLTSEVCSGHGTCVDIEQCSCYPGYNGDFCDYPICFGFNSIHPLTCSYHGACIGPDLCNCTDGYVGEKCSIPVCYNIFGNESNVCSGHGSCIEPNTCQCSGTWEDATCNINRCNGIRSDSIEVCSSHGVCYDQEKCTCSSGYHGKYCGTHECFGVLSDSNLTCSSHGICSALNECSCTQGWGDNACQNPICFEHLSTSSSACSGHGSCVAPDQCTCNYLYELHDCSRSLYPVAVLNHPDFIGKHDSVVLDGSFSTSYFNAPLTYLWEIKSSGQILSGSETVISESKNQVTIPSYLISGVSVLSVSLRVRAINGALSNFVNGTIYRKDEIIPKITINGPSQLYIYRNQSVRLQAHAIIQQNIGSSTSENITFHWSQLSGHTINISNPTQSRLVIPKHSFPSKSVLSVYKFKVTANYTTEKTSSTKIISIHVLVSNLVPFISGQKSLTVSIGESFSITGKNSIDPDASTEQALYLWECDKCLFDIPQYHTLSFSPYRLQLGSYVFTLNYQVGSRKASESIVVNVIASKAFNVPLPRYIFINDWETVYLDVDNLDFSISDYQWYGTENVSSSNKVDRFKIDERRSLAFKPYSLTPGQKYSFTFNVVVSNQNITSTTDIIVNQNPVYGGVSVSPLTGVVGATQFEIIAYEWKDLDDHYPLQYKLELQNNDTTILIKPYSTLNSKKFTVPLVGSFDVILFVKDSKGGVSKIKGPRLVSTQLHFADSETITTVINSMVTMNDNPEWDDMSEMLVATTFINSFTNFSCDAQCKQTLTGKIDSYLSQLDILFSSHEVDDYTSALQTLLEISKYSNLETFSTLFSLYERTLCSISNEFINHSLFEQTLTSFSSLLERLLTLQFSSELVRVYHHVTSILQCMVKQLDSELIEGELPSVLESDFFSVSVYKDFEYILNETLPSMNLTYSKNISLSIPLSLLQSLHEPKSTSIQLLRYFQFDNQSTNYLQTQTRRSSFNEILSATIDFGFYQNGVRLDLPAIDYVFHIHRQTGPSSQPGCYQFVSGSFVNDACTTTENIDSIVCSCPPNAPVAVLVSPTLNVADVLSPYSDSYIWLVVIFVFIFIFFCLLNGIMVLLLFSCFIKKVMLDSDRLKSMTSIVLKGTFKQKSRQRLAFYKALEARMHTYSPQEQLVLTRWKEMIEEQDHRLIISQSQLSNLESPHELREKLSIMKRISIANTSFIDALKTNIELNSTYQHRIENDPRLTTANNLKQALVEQHDQSHSNFNSAQARLASLESEKAKLLQFFDSYEQKMKDIHDTVELSSVLKNNAINGVTSDTDVSTRKRVQLLKSMLLKKKKEHLSRVTKYKTLIKKYRDYIDAKSSSTS